MGSDPFLRESTGLSRLSLKGHARLGGSWVVINGVISRVTILMNHTRGLITPLRTTHEPPRDPIQLGIRRLVPRPGGASRKDRRGFTV